MRKKIKKTLFALVAILLALCLFEGLLSFVFMFARWAKAPYMAEKKHVQYDPDLGWSHIPGIRIRDMYGKGKNLTINRQGFRAGREFDKKAGPGLFRVICLGDSFTLGFGSGDKHTWPSCLEAAKPGLEAVNMGQGGYGVDQMLLWYAREKERLDHDLLVLAFIDEDIIRMNWKNFAGYEKPFLKLENNAIQVKNHPAPKSGFSFLRQVDRAVMGSHIRVLAGNILKGIFGETTFQGMYGSEAELAATAVAAFEGVRDLAERSGVQLVVVRLPQDHGRTIQVVDLVGEQLVRRGFVYFDLFNKAKSLPGAVAGEMFLTRENADPALLDYLTFEGHYTDKGNEVAARMILEQLEEEGLLTKPKPE